VRDMGLLQEEIFCNYSFVLAAITRLGYSYQAMFFKGDQPWECGSNVYQFDASNQSFRCRGLGGFCVFGFRDSGRSATGAPACNSGGPTASSPACDPGWPIASSASCHPCWAVAGASACSASERHSCGSIAGSTACNSGWPATGSAARDSSWSVAGATALRLISSSDHLS
jgi:hypothetical protein